MKKAVLLSLIAVISTSAVEWETEQVTDSKDVSCGMPLLVLNSDGNPQILFGEYNNESGATYIKSAVKQSGSWVTKTVADVSDFMALSYSFDIAPDGHTVVTFADMMDSSKADIFLATDASGSFSTSNLTDGGDYEMLPVVHVDKQGKIHIVFFQGKSDLSDSQLYYGRLVGSTFTTERATSDYMPDGMMGFDFILDNNGQPHVVYPAEDTFYNLTLSVRISANNWTKEHTGIDGEWPSAAIDGSGNLHIAYGNMDVRYLSNKSGSWKAEVVSEQTSEGFPSIALDPGDDPHAAWWRFPFEEVSDVCYSGKAGAAWSQPQVLPPLNTEKNIGYGHFFATDKQGYGHLTYVAQDSDYVNHIYYAKSKTSLATGIIEPSSPPSPSSPPQNPTPILEIKGSLICLDLPQSSFVRLSLYDATGRMVRELGQGFYTQGQNEIGWSSENLPSGVYFARLQAGSTSLNSRMVLIR